MAGAGGPSSASQMTPSAPTAMPRSSTRASVVASNRRRQLAVRGLGHPDATGRRLPPTILAGSTRWLPRQSDRPAAVRLARLPAIASTPTARSCSATTAACAAPSRAALPGGETAGCSRSNEPRSPALVSRSGWSTSARPPSSDVGGTWGDNRFGPHRRGVPDVVIGLRLGNSHAALGNVLHIDLAFPLGGDPRSERAVAAQDQAGLLMLRQWASLASRPPARAPRAQPQSPARRRSPDVAFCWSLRSAACSPATTARADDKGHQYVAEHLPGGDGQPLRRALPVWRSNTAGRGAVALGYSRTRRQPAPRRTDALRQLDLRGRSLGASAYGFVDWLSFRWRGRPAAAAAPWPAGSAVAACPRRASMAATARCGMSAQVSRSPRPRRPSPRRGIAGWSACNSSAFSSLRVSIPWQILAGRRRRHRGQIGFDADYDHITPFAGTRDATPARTWTVSPTSCWPCRCPQRGVFTAAPRGRASRSPAIPTPRATASTSVMPRWRSAAGTGPRPGDRPPGATRWRRRRWTFRCIAASTATSW